MNLPVKAARNGKRRFACVLREYAYDLKRNKMIYLMLLPVVAYFVIFKYVPLFGIQIAFKNFSPFKGIIGSPWVGLKNFKSFFESYYFVRLLSNTLLISIFDIIAGFPAPIIFALMLNEIRSKRFKSAVQTISYLPHFISTVVVGGMILDFFSRNGVVNNVLNIFGIDTISFMSSPEWFRPIFVGTNIWQHMGWSSIIYLAALSGIDIQLYEAATIDGANRFKQLIYVTIPGILPTIIIMLILRLGSIMTVGFEKIMLLYNPATYQTADVISTFVYRKGILESSYSYSTAVDLFNSMINFTLLVIVNKFSKKVSETSLW